MNKPTFEDKGDYAVAYMVAGEPITEDQFIKTCNIDLEKWRPESFKPTCWDAQLKGGKIRRLYGAKMICRLRPDYDDAKIILEVFKEQAARFAPKLTTAKYPKKKKPAKSHLLEVDLFDVHLEKLAWAEETGEDLSLEECCRLYAESLEIILARAQGWDIDRILFPIGNDFFNADDWKDSTTRGTPQECSARWKRVYREGQNLLVNAIERLRHIAPVDVVIIPGNHSRQRIFYIGEALSLWTASIPEVTVDNRACERKYYQYHKTLLGFSHGQERDSDLPVIMSQEVSPEQWAETKYREWHIAHTHHKRDIKYISVNEKTGVVIRRLQALTAADDWLYRKGFIGAGRGATGFIWSKDQGLISQVYSNL